MPREKFPAPVSGISDATPAIDQPGAVTDPDGLLNMVPEDSDSGRKRLSTRDKLASEFSGAANTGRVNAIGEISRASGVSGTQLTSLSQSTAGDTRFSGVFKGQFLVLDTDRSVRVVWADTRGTAALIPAPPVGPGGFGGFGVCWHETDPNIGYGFTIASDTTNGDTGGKVIVGVNRLNVSTGFLTQQIYCVDSDTFDGSGGAYGTSPILANQMVAHGAYLFIAAYRYVYVFRSFNLEYIGRKAIDWSGEAQSLAVVTVNGLDYLLVLSTGNTTTTGASNPVVADSVGSELFGEFYRTNIQKYLITYLNPAKDPVAVGSTVLTRQRMPMGLASGGAGYEDHRGYRFSEYSAARPRGCLAYAMAVTAGSDGSVHAFVARTNQGFGYNANAGHEDQRPDGAGPYISACRVVLTRAFEADSPNYMDPAAPVKYGTDESVGGWERDTDSLRRAFTWGANTYLNDIPPITAGLRDPQALDKGPTLWAVAVDTTRQQVYFAGRRPSLTLSGPNVFCFDIETGDLLWEQDVKGVVQQNGIAVDPVSGNLLVAMTRSDGWTTPDGTISGNKAEVLELGHPTGAVVNSFDLTDASHTDFINVNGYITAANQATLGLGAYGVAVNSRGQVLVALAPMRWDQ